MRMQMIVNEGVWSCPDGQKVCRQASAYKDALEGLETLGIAYCVNGRAGIYLVTAEARTKAQQMALQARGYAPAC